MARTFGKLAVGLAALSLAAMPAVAAGNAASKLSLRAATNSDRDSQLAAMGFVALAVVTTVVVGTVLAATDSDTDSN